ncbi:dienelactone hydrolase family protein [Clavibacter capsici]|uniref:dienelactone hydrolase family protein n=1 Tax=Clavibacter capsici TaxID=1874630 RepID=UPI001FFD543B|nr:dienelactone hydrolase family protein [Clavibacter capsici]
MTPLLPRRCTRSTALTSAFVLAVACAAALAGPVTAHADDAGKVDEITVPRNDVSGFGGGTVFAPEVTAGTKLGAVIVTPGYSDTQADMRWYGTDLAAAGFVVFTIDTLHTQDRPQARADEMLAASDYLTGSSAVADEVDPDRVAVLGYSFGGGGALAAAEARHSLRAAIALMPFDVRVSYRADITPSLIITGQSDHVAFPFLMGKRMYRSLPASTPRQYLELRGVGHAGGERTPNDTIRDAVITFLDRYLDDDDSATARICPAPAATGPISASMSYCG